VYLIAVTGPVGSGKTRLLTRLLGATAGLGLAADGFVAPAAGRDDPRRGAAAYDLHWPEARTRLPFARRERTGYAFDADTLAAARRWARGLAACPRLDLVVMDEFGQVEATGDGLMALWPDVRDARPAACALAVREGFVDAIATRLDEPFARIIACDDPGAWPALAAACGAHRPDGPDSVL